MLKSKSLPRLAGAAALGGALSLVMLAVPALAVPLHGYCLGTGQCVDNGTNSPSSINPPNDFGFASSGGSATGDVRIDILVPDNTTPPSTFALTGTVAATATPFDSTLTSPWTSSTLAAYLGITASPDNPIGAYLPSTKVFQPSATGFFVFQADLGSVTLPGTSASNPEVIFSEDLSSRLALGSYIVAFQNQGGTSLAATANSGAIFVTPAPVIGHGLLVLLAVGGILFGARLWEQRKRRSVGPAIPHAAA